MAAHRCPRRGGGRDDASDADAHAEEQCSKTQISSSNGLLRRDMASLMRLYKVAIALVARYEL